jgi:tRNA U34 2-thiouridine synthase MnmA/TrmU
MKAIALISGGLDSTLATRLVQDLGIELIALNTFSPFCLCNHRAKNGCFHGAASLAKELGIRLVSVNVSEEFIRIVKHPAHGYGSNLNPCIDCRILLFKKAKELMRQEGASFVVSGEVLGQRPMSQRRQTMLLIEKDAGLQDLVLRPLSAKVLAATLPEREGWVNRDKLLAFSGRGRKEQFALASEMGLKDFPCPSGGCLLTDPGFAKRLKDLMRHHPDFTLNDIQLLKLGRHFRLHEQAKLVVGRDEKENTAILDLAREDDCLFAPAGNLAGPTALGRGNFAAGEIELCVRIVSRYSDLNGNKEAEIIVKKTAAAPQLYKALPLEQTWLMSLRV